MQRPTSVLVLGILNIMFGVLGVFGLFGSAAILLGMNPSNPMNRILESSDFYRYYLWTSFVLGFFATIVLLAAGAGLIMSKPWARPATIGYGVYAIIMGLVGQIISAVFVIGPLMEKASGTGGPENIGAAAGAIGGTLGGCVGLIYPIVLLVFMFRKNIVDYFQSLRSPGGQPPLQA